MAGIHLIAQSDGEVVIPVPGGPPLTLPKRRIRAWVLLGNQVVLRQAIIDTGAPYCTLTRRVWADLDQRGQIDWVAFPPGGPGASLPTMELLGGKHPFRIGRVAIRLTELAANSPILATDPVLALCVESDTLSDVIQSGVILGLGGLLNGRTLVVQASEVGDRWSAVLIQP